MVLLQGFIWNEQGAVALKRIWGQTIFKFPNLSSYNINNQLVKYEKNISVGSRFQCNDLKVQIIDSFFKSLPSTHALFFLTYPFSHSQEYRPCSLTHFSLAPHTSTLSEHSSLSAKKIRAVFLRC